MIAHYQQGQVFQPTTLEMINGETSPPPYLTEADLIALMEKHGIGEHGKGRHALFIFVIKILIELLQVEYFRASIYRHSCHLVAIFKYTVHCVLL